MFKKTLLTLVTFNAALLLVACQKPASVSSETPSSSSPELSLSSSETPSSSEEASSSAASGLTHASLSMDGTYYKNIDWTLKGATLKTALYNLIKTHTDHGYSGLWTAYKTTDMTPEGKIWDMYSTYRWTYSTDQCGNYSSEGDCYNREHTIPQSIFNEAAPMKGDIHHIFPTDGKVNGARSDYPHGNVKDSSVYKSTNNTQVGNGDPSYGYSGICCEPADEYKGDFARAYFYFVTAYQDKIPSYSYASFAQNTYPSLASWALKTYTEWASTDPVSEKELKRNDAAYVYQGNRNPFIDHPEIVSAIWGNL
jgi:endonuclease I